MMEAEESVDRAISEKRNPSAHLHEIKDYPTPKAKRIMRVTMLVANPCVNDSRVIREAEALSRAGHDVTIIAVRNGDLPAFEVKNGVSYRRVPFGINNVLSQFRVARYTRRGLLGLLNAVFTVLGFIGTLKTSQAVFTAGGDQVQMGRGRVMRSALKKSLFGLVWIGRAVFLSMLTVVAIPVMVFVVLPLIVMALALRQSPGESITGAADRIRGDIARLKRGVGLVLKRIRLAVYDFATTGSTARNRLIGKLFNHGGPLRPFAVYTAVENAFMQPAIGQRPDVIHAHDLNTLPAAFAASEVCGARVIFDSHELATLELEKESIFSRYYKKRVEKKLIVMTDGMVTVSRGFVDIFQNWYGVKPPVVIYNTPKFSKYPAYNADVRAALGFSSDVPLAVYIGGINPRRALSELVESLQYAPELHMVKVGPRVKQWESLMVETAEKVGVLDRLHFVDPVDPEEIVHFCRTADIGIVTRLNLTVQQEYSMPNKLFETAFSGLPIVAGDTAEIRDFIDRYGIGVTVDCSRPELLGKAMWQVYLNRERLKPTPETLAQLNDEFGWSAQEHKLVALYDDLLHIR